MTTCVLALCPRWITGLLFIHKNIAMLDDSRTGGPCPINIDTKAFEKVKDGF